MNKSEKCSTTQVGRIVIHRGDTEKRVYEDELNLYIQDGWIKGISETHRKNNSLVHEDKPSWNKGLTKDTSESIRRTAEKLAEMYKGKEPWNKGLTKETDIRVYNNSVNSSTTKIERYGSAFPNNNMNEEHKRKISESLKNKPFRSRGPMNDITKKHISEAKKGYKHTQCTKNKISKAKKGAKLSEEALQIKLTKQYLTRKKNNSFNKSEPEEQLYETLLKENVNKTIYRQYKDIRRYPFYCDFYIVEDDLFIELNAHWTHGGKPFDPQDPSCQEQLKLWQEKAKTSQFYANAIIIWTERDVKKAECAKKNKLNYKVIY